jgi:hypothetical protein
MVVERSERFGETVFGRDLVDARRLRVVYRQNEEAAEPGFPIQRRSSCAGAMRTRYHDVDCTCS